VLTPSQLAVDVEALLTAFTWGVLWWVASGAKSRLDPGRARLGVEYLRNGRDVLDLPLDGGGSLVVTRHAASENWAPPNAPRGAEQEWRVLRFRPAEGTSDLVQAVAKVWIEPPVLRGDSDAPSRVWQLGDVVALAYSKTLLSVVLAALCVLGMPVMGLGAGDGRGVTRMGEGLRFLCIGLGGGTVASYLASVLPRCRVDAVELEPAVVTAATEAMGFATTDRLQLTVDDGAAFALRAVERIEGSEEGAYDAVLVDAYDADGGVPEAFRTPGLGLALALERGLLPLRRGGVVAANLLPNFGATGAVGAYGAALAARHVGPGFSVRELDPRESNEMGNFIAVQTCGEAVAGLGHDELQKRLRKAGGEVAEALQCPFDMADLAVRGFAPA